MVDTALVSSLTGGQGGLVGCMEAGLFHIGKLELVKDTSFLGFFMDVDALMMSFDWHSVTWCSFVEGKGRVRIWYLSRTDSY